VSTVAFARQLFPKEAFVAKSYGGVNIEVLRPVDSNGGVVNDGALRVHEWLEKGAFKALDQNYLEKVTFNILDAHPSDFNAKILESYSFGVAGTDAQGKPLSIAFEKKTNNSLTTTTSTNRALVTKEEVHSAMQQLVKTLLVRSSLPQNLDS
jgi:HORMA domain